MVQAWTSTVISIERLQTLISIERLSDDIARLFLPIFMLRGKLFCKTAVVTCQPVYMFAALGWIPAVSKRLSGENTGGFLEYAAVEITISTYTNY